MTVSEVDIEAGLVEMDFAMVDNGIMKLPSSKPAAYAVLGDATPDLDALEDALGEHDFSLMRRRCKVRDDGKFYCHFRIMTDHYKEVGVKSWNDKLRIYPREDQPDTYEFARILHAIEDAFGVDLEHDPIREEPTSGGDDGSA